ncbi:MAG TPA: Ig-like domain-containing protein [Solirubrobacteraceae bacterium]|jgi:hypothetical protein
MTAVRRCVLLAALALVAFPAAADAANNVPVCHGTTLAVAPGGARTFSIHCEDFDGPETLSIEIVDAPAKGTVEDLARRRLSYRPGAGQTGSDSFTFRATDGEDTTPVVTQHIEITDANLAPRCLPIHLTAINGTGYVQQPCYDPNEGDAAFFIVDQQSQHGQVHINHYGDSVSYDAYGYAGADAFSLKATDGELTGPPTEITVDAVPQTPPVCESRPPLPVRPDTSKRVLLTCRDNTPYANSIAMSFGQIDAPDHGELEFMYGSVTYVPDEGYTGPDEFTLQPRTNAGDGPALTIQAVVSPDANEPPTCSTRFPVRLRTGASSSVPASCYDPDGDALETTFDPPPSHGAIATSNGFPYGSVYTADEGYAGPDHYGLRAKDAASQSATATQQLEIVGDDENTVPECEPVISRVRNNRTTSIPVRCNDAEGDPTTFTWTDPEHGSIEFRDGSFPFGGFFVYTPDPGYVGMDATFSFRADDGHGGQTPPISAVIDVLPAEAPTCTPPPRRAVRTGGKLNLQLSCATEERPVYPVLHDGPAHGTVTTSGYGYFTYEPDAGYEGTDTFTVRATNDVGSDDMVQEIDVGPDVNTVPHCGPHYNAVTRQAPLVLRIYCYDDEGDPMTLSTVTAPSHGDLGEWDQEQQQVTYTPDDGFTGDDTFTFRAYDGRGHSEPVEQKVRVQAPDANEAPRCYPNVLWTDPDESTSVWVNCQDGDGDPLTIEVVEQPGHGTVAKHEYGYLEYTPDPGFAGRDQFTVAASDGLLTSKPATVDVQVGPATYPFPPPACSPLAANVERDKARRIQLRCSAVMVDVVPAEIVDGPAHGTLSAVDENGWWVTYTPDPGFEGADSFTYRGRLDDEVGAPATVQLNVVAPKPPAEEPADTGTQQEPPPPDAPPPPTPPPPPPGADPVELAAEQRLGGDAVPLGGLNLGTTRAFVPAGAAGGSLTVDSPSEKLLALVCATACDASADQQITLGGAGTRAAAAKAKRIKLRRQRLRLQAGTPGVVVLRLTKAQRRKVRRARRATLVLRIAVKDARGKTVRGTARFRLKAR